MVSKLDASLLKAFAERRLEEAYPYVLLDARYEKVREEGSVRSRAVQIALGIDGEGRRQVLAAEVANRESEVSWTEFLSHLKERGLRGVEYVVSDSHEGLKHAISKVLPTALWQRCCVHFLRNAMDKLSRSADPACLEGLKRLWGHEHVGEAREALGAWVTHWDDEKGFGKLVEWVEDHVEETLTVYRLPRDHRLRMKSTNMLERYNEELRRRTRVVRIFPNAESCLRLILALAAETHERWLTGQRYLLWPDRRGSRLRTGIRGMAGGGMRRPKISCRAETRPYGRVSAPTRNCRRFLTQLDFPTHGLPIPRPDTAGVAPRTMLYLPGLDWPPCLAPSRATRCAPAPRPVAVGWRGCGTPGRDYIRATPDTVPGMPPPAERPHPHRRHATASANPG